MKILLIYHFFYPDSVVSARIFSDLASFLSSSGKDVTVYTCNHLIRSEQKLPRSEEWNHVHIRRFRRPFFPQSSNIGRMINSIVLQIQWTWSLILHRGSFDSIIVGTDPQFAWAMFPWIKLFNRKSCLIHWIFDLYPEAIIAGSSTWLRLIAQCSKLFAKLSYRCCDYIVDIGSEMQKLVKTYGHHAESMTLTPWALKEPDKIADADPEIRKQLFGNAKLALLYSGTVGHAHDLLPFITLARQCRERGIDAAFCFSGYGNCYKEQTSLVTSEDTNIRLVDFASEEELEKRLSSADILMVSLRSNWNGIVVPSKFFGSLAIGRPVLFSGPENNSLAEYCKNEQIGLLLSHHTADDLQKIISKEEIINHMKANAFNVYKTHFSKKQICNQWLNILDGI